MITAGTGLDSFTNPDEITALYPFPGWEVLFVVLGAALLIGWNVRQMLDENREYDEALELYGQVGMERVMHFSGSSSPVTDEDIEAVEAEIKQRHGTAGNTAEREPEGSGGSGRAAGNP